MGETREQIEYQQVEKTDYVAVEKISYHYSGVSDQRRGEQVGVKEGESRVIGTSHSVPAHPLGAYGGLHGGAYPGTYGGAYRGTYGGSYGAPYGHPANAFRSQYGQQWGSQFGSRYASPDRRMQMQRPPADVSADVVEKKD